MCPVCLVAVCTGLGLSRWLKIDDTISGLWIGGLIISLSFVFAKLLKTSVLLNILVFFLTIVFPLKYLKIIGNPLNRFCGIDKLIFGIITGMMAFSLSILLHLYLKRKHHHKSYFPFQKVIIPVLTLILISLIFYEYFKNF